MCACCVWKAAVFPPEICIFNPDAPGKDKTDIRHDASGAEDHIPLSISGGSKIQMFSHVQNVFFRASPKEGALEIKRKIIKTSFPWL